MRWDLTAVNALLPQHFRWRSWIYPRSRLVYNLSLITERHVELFTHGAFRLGSCTVHGTKTLGLPPPYCHRNQRPLRRSNRSLRPSLPPSRAFWRRIKATGIGEAVHSL